MTVTGGVYTSGSYIASVGLENAIGVSWVNSDSVDASTTPPANVTSLTVHRALSSLVLEWPQVTGTTGYDIVYSSNDRASWTRAVSGMAGGSGATRTYTISTGIDNSSTYHVGIRARSSAGASGWTNSAAVLPAITPRPAWHLDVTRSDGALSVIWQQCDVNARSCNGGSEITSFAINLSANNGATWTRAVTITNPTSGSDGLTIGSDRWTVALSNNITNATQYIVSVGIRNRMGTSWVNHGPIDAFGG